jgi:hypothetical protein
MINPMTTRTQQANSRRWVLPFLAALVAVLTIVGLAGSASATSSPTAGTRVGASAGVVEVPVEPPEHIAAGQRLGEVVAGPQIVVATGVAANAVTRAPQVLRVGELKLSAVPKGVVGTPTTTGKGLEYAIPRGTPELSERVASIRIMDPVTTGKNVYPNGYAVYMNAQGQRVNPLTGQMIHDLSDPFAHIPLP